MPESKKDKIVSKLKELADIALGKEETVETVEAKFMDAKLTDGTIIRYEADELATGVVVMVVDEGGNLLPLPLGSYEIEDGTTFDVVDEMGTIDNVVIKEESEETEEVEEMEETTASTVEEPKAKAITESVVKKTEFEAEVETETEVKAEVEVEAKVEVEEVVEEVMVTEQSFSAYKEAKETEIAEIKSMVEGIFKAIEEIGAEDVATETETKKNVFKSESSEPRMTLKEIRAQFKADLMHDVKKNGRARK